MKKEDILNFTESEKEQVLKNFMEEMFYFEGLKQMGIFNEELRNDYKAQAERICEWFGFKTVFEYGKDEVRCHLSTDNPQKDFITVVKSIYE